MSTLVQQVAKCSRCGRIKPLVGGRFPVHSLISTPGVKCPGSYERITNPAAYQPSLEEK